MNMLFWIIITLQQCNFQSNINQRQNIVIYQMSCLLQYTVFIEAYLSSQSLLIFKQQRKIKWNAGFYGTFILDEFEPGCSNEEKLQHKSDKKKPHLTGKLCFLFLVHLNKIYSAVAWLKNVV